jgi:hypothetical protein
MYVACSSIPETRYLAARDSSWRDIGLAIRRDDQQGTSRTSRLHVIDGYAICLEALVHEADRGREEQEEAEEKNSAQYDFASLAESMQVRCCCKVINAGTGHVKGANYGGLC